MLGPVQGQIRVRRPYTLPEDALTIKDVVSQAKEAKSKSKIESAELKAADSNEGPKSIKK